MESQKLEQSSVPIPDDPAWESSKKFLDEHQRCHPHTEALSDCFRCNWLCFRNISIKRIASLTAQVATLESDIALLHRNLGATRETAVEKCHALLRLKNELFSENERLEQQVATLEQENARLAFDGEASRVYANNVANHANEYLERIATLEKAQEIRAASIRRLEQQVATLESEKAAALKEVGQAQAYGEQLGSLSAPTKEQHK